MLLALSTFRNPMCGYEGKPVFRHSLFCFCLTWIHLTNRNLLERLEAGCSYATTL
jgi:hypothetical protein